MSLRARLSLSKKIAHKLATPENTLITELLLTSFSLRFHLRLATHRTNQTATGQLRLTAQSAFINH